MNAMRLVVAAGLAATSRDSYCVDKTRMIKELVDLKVASPLDMGVCAVAIPNHEVRQVFELDIMTKASPPS